MPGRPVRFGNDLAVDESAPGHLNVLSAPTLVDIQLTRRCPMGCPHCYVAARPDGAHMDCEDTRLVLRACADAGVCQLALGGGEPLLHPRIIDILAEAHALGLVPNLTTTGLDLDEPKLEALARYAGAVALSLEAVGEEFGRYRRAGFAFFEEAQAKLRRHHIPMVFQVTLSRESLLDLPSVIDYCLTVPDLYGVIFLAYKAVGRGEGFHAPLSSVAPAELYPILRDAFMRLGAHTRVGYDCCLTPAIVGIDEEFGFSEQDLLEGCSAARGSVGVSVELDVLPCTFLGTTSLGNLRTASLHRSGTARRPTHFAVGWPTPPRAIPPARVAMPSQAVLGGVPNGAWSTVPDRVFPNPREESSIRFLTSW